ncbi:MAG: DUF819 family protein [Planctomycetia bacterium]|nr:DUF819 family protein [Planctomycetia bacterium]MCC7314882.1 DUF819 family protein [Planctomycetota bacterium]OQY98111.1 MAG: hypothetical protein B6D36_18015 [Planctomycetes bacterium UTPLA1]
MLTPTAELLLANVKTNGPLISDPAGLLAVLFSVLAIIFWAQSHRVGGRLFKVVPSVVFCYFVPTALSGFGVIPNESPMYEWVKQFILPASLVLLTLSLDVPAIMRLGPKALIVMLAGTLGIMLGGPIALAIWQHWLPDDAWRRMSYLAGSWIGGGANAVALQKTFGVSDAAISPIIVVDVAVANMWTGVLLYWAGRSDRVDRWLKADASAIRILEGEIQDFQNSVTRPASLRDLLYVVAIGFGFAYLGHAVGKWIMGLEFFARLGDYLNAFAWKVIIATTAGVTLSFTRMRKLEGAGASKIGSLMLYLLIACIGAGADFRRLTESGAFLGLGLTWILIHIGCVLLVGKLIRAPFFFIAVGSQANIGGAASAPIVAGAFNPLLAPVGVLLAILGYVLGTYGGLVCVNLCRLIAE